MHLAAFNAVMSFVSLQMWVASAATVTLSQFGRVSHFNFDCCNIQGSVLSDQLEREMREI